MVRACINLLLMRCQSYAVRDCSKGYTYLAHYKAAADAQAQDLRPSALEIAGHIPGHGIFPKISSLL